MVGYFLKLLFLEFKWLVNNVKFDDPIVFSAVDCSRFKYVVNKYKKMGLTEAEAILMAKRELGGEN